MGSQNDETMLSKDRLSHVTRKDSQNPVDPVSSQNQCQRHIHKRQVEGLHWKQPKEADLSCREIPAPDIQQHLHQCIAKKWHIQKGDQCQSLQSIHDSQGLVKSRKISRPADEARRILGQASGELVPYWFSIYVEIFLYACRENPKVVRIQVIKTLSSHSMVQSTKLPVPTKGGCITSIVPHPTTIIHRKSSVLLRKVDCSNILPYCTLQHNIFVSR